MKTLTRILLNSDRTFENGPFSNGGSVTELLKYIRNPLMSRTSRTINKHV